MFYHFNKDVNLPGIYKCPDFNVLGYVESLQNNKDELKRVKNKFSEDRKIAFCDSWVYLVNASKYNLYTGDLNRKALIRELNEIPENVRQTFLDTLSIPYLYPIDTLNNQKPVISNQKSIANTLSEKFDLEKELAK
jgi:hypothetical protein